MNLVPPVILTEQRRKLADAIEAERLLQDLLWLWPMHDNAEHPIGQFGGRPSLPDDMKWPISPTTNEPIHFLFQVDLARLPDCNNPHRARMPSNGLVLVFAGLTFNYIDGVTGNCPGLIRVIFVPNGKLGDVGRKPPPDLPSPFTAPDAWMPLTDANAVPPDDGTIPQCPMGAEVMPELLAPKTGSSILASADLARCYDAIRRNLADNEAHRRDHARLVTRGHLEPLREFNVIRMFSGDVPYENAPALCDDMNDPVHFFTLQLPPRSGVFAGDPMLDILVESSALKTMHLDDVRANIDVS